MQMACVCPVHLQAHGMHLSDFPSNDAAVDIVLMGEQSLLDCERADQAATKCVLRHILAGLALHVTAASNSLKPKGQMDIAPLLLLQPVTPMPLPHVQAERNGGRGAGCSGGGLRAWVWAQHRLPREHDHEAPRPTGHRGRGEEVDAC